MAPTVTRLCCVLPDGRAYVPAQIRSAVAWSIDKACRPSTTGTGSFHGGDAGAQRGTWLELRQPGRMMTLR